MDASVLTRRGLLAAAALGASAGAARRADAEPVAVRADVDPGASLFRLVQRISFGANDYEVSLARFLGFQGYLDYHLNPAAIPDSAAEAMVAPLANIWLQPFELYSDNRFVNSTQVRYDLMHARALRAFASRRQLFERAVEMWSDHFNIDINAGVCTVFMVAHDRDVIRPNALGKFPDLLRAVAQSPAMLHYLNSDISSFDRPNQNFARELLELHTMGSQGGYTQADVENVARCFTGWTIWPLNAQPESLRGTFRFDPTSHDFTAKTVLGQTIPAGGGVEDGQQVLNILASHPSTARFVGYKVARCFLGEPIPASVIDAAAAAYMATGGDIKAMIRAVVTPNLLASAPVKLKRPMHLFTSMMRAVPTTISWSDGLRREFDLAWNLPFSWGPPNGYPDSVEYWSGNMMPRWNFAARLTSASGNFFSFLGDVAGVVVDDVPVFSNAATADQMVQRIDRFVFGGEITPEDRAALTTFLAADPQNRQRRREALGLAFSLPSFQWY